MNKEKLLPIRINRKVAKAVGLKESLFIIRIMELSKLNNENIKIHDGLIWVKRSLKEWHNDFYFMPIDTIRRILSKLREKNIIYAENLNNDKMNNTLWYSINVSELNFLITGDTGSSELNERLKKEKLQKK
ncbi:hypothetical protein [Clostridium thermobutyricum]|uniref:hypothetical protein n=1 Tax=Clostridium thermobutyricum TaxID=29372 RepID=UPI003F526FD5